MFTKIMRETHVQIVVMASNVGQCITDVPLFGVYDNVGTCSKLVGREI